MDVASRKKQHPMINLHHTLTLDTDKGVGLIDITDQIRDWLAAEHVEEGMVAVTSRHTTTALTINENEARLLDDVRQFLHRFAPPDHPYLHNDIHLRDCPQDEPENAHSHLCAMMLGSSEVISVSSGDLLLGQWQSVMLVELDGPRTRSVGLQFLGE